MDALDRRRRDRASEEAIHVLVVEDDPEFATTAAVALERAADFAVRTVADADAALTEIETAPVDAVVSDYRLPGTDGIELLERVRAVDPDLPFVLLTGRGDEQVATAALSAGATEYMRKSGPVPFRRLANRLQDAVGRIRAEREREAARRRRRERFEGSAVGLWIEDFSAVKESVESLQAAGVEDVEAYLEAHPGELADMARSVEVVSVNETVLEMYRADSVSDFRQGLSEIFGPESMPAFREVAGAIARGEQNFRTEKTDRRLDGEPISIILHWSVTAEAGYERVHVSTIDVSEREARERRLAKRERLFRALYESSRHCLSANSQREVFDHVAASIVDSLSLLEVTVLEFDAAEARLEPVTSAGLSVAETDPVEPGGSTVWEAFRTGETRRLDRSESIEAAVAVPIGDFGVLLARSPDFEDVDIEMTELCVATAEAVLDRIRRESERDELEAELSGQQTRVEKVRGLLEATQSILQDVDGADRTAIEDRAVSELVSSDPVDFAWIGHPSRADDELEPAAWAGFGAGYLDAIDPEDATDPSPGQQAGRERSQVSIDQITAHVGSAGWAKAAVSLGYSSVLAEPLLADDVLYGVLVVYSREADAFGADCRALLSDVGSLLTTFYGLQNVRSAAVRAGGVELEFAIRDSTDPLAALAARAGVSLTFETVLEPTETGVRILASVEDAPASLPDVAMALTAVTEASWFGGPATQRLALEVTGPVLATGVRKHGGRLESAVADGAESVVTITLPPDRPARPLIEWLQRTYPDIELLARREATPDRQAPASLVDHSLTDRQLEVLKAAYFGGYYDSPRSITGEELAESFGISDSAVYKHLRAAHRTLLEDVLVSGSDNQRFDT